jgi:hypothetical protein
MDAFGYLSVLLSIILGLAITQLLQGLRGLLIARRAVIFYLPPVVWTGLLLLMAVQSWWSMYGMYRRTTWTFGQFGLVLLQTIVLYMLAALVLPDLDASESRDLKRHYFDQRRWFFGLGTLLLIVSVAKDLVLDGRMPSPANLAFHATFFVAWAIAAFTRNEKYHQALPGFMALSFGAYIVLLFARL